MNAQDKINLEYAKREKEKEIKCARITRQFERAFVKLDEYFLKHRKITEIKKNVAGVEMVVKTRVKIEHPDDDDTYFKSLQDKLFNLHEEGKMARWQSTRLIPDPCTSSECTAIIMKRTRKKGTKYYYNYETVRELMCKKFVDEQRCPLTKSYFTN